MHIYGTRRLIKLMVVVGAAVLASATGANATTGVRATSATGSYYTGPLGGELARASSSAVTETATLTAGSGNVQCTTATEDGSEGSGMAGNDLAPNPSATSVAGNIQSLFFKNCKDNVFGQTCTVTVNTMPYSASVLAVLGQTYDATLTVNNPSVTISGCNCLNCTFTASSVTARVYNPGNPNRPDTTGPDQAAGQVYFPSVALTGSGSNCWIGTSGSWTANYALRTSTATPGNLWVTPN